MVGSDEKISYLKSLCEETYLKDIIAHNKIKKKTELADTFNITASMIGSPVNVSEKTDRIDANGKSIYAQKALEVDFIAFKGYKILYSISTFDGRY